MSEDNIRKFPGAKAEQDAAVKKGGANVNKGGLSRKNVPEIQIDFAQKDDLDAGEESAEKYADSDAGQDNSVKNSTASQKRSGDSGHSMPAGSRGARTDGKFEHSEIDIDQDEQTKKALARMAQIEERNANMERITLEREKVVGADVEKTVQDGIQIKKYSVAKGADTIFNVRTESEIEKELENYRDRSQREDEIIGGRSESSEISAEEAAAAIKIDPEEVAEKLAQIVKDDRIVCIGDSITYGFEVDGSLTWIGRLRREEEINLLNVGINGDTCGNMFARFKEHVVDLSPKAVFIMGGGNDILAGTPLEYITNSVAMMAQMALDKGIVPMIGIAPEPSPKDVPAEWKQLMDYDQVREQMATYKEWLITFAKANLLPYIDFDSEMKNKLRSGYGRYFFDGVHPNPAGHKIMAGIAKTAFQDMGILAKPTDDDRFAL